MPRISRHAHLKPAAIAMFDAGDSTQSVALRYPELPRATIYDWHREWSANHSGNYSGNHSGIPTTATAQGSEPLPPPSPMITVMEGGRGEDEPLSLAAELRKLRRFLYAELRNPGPHSVAVAQLGHAIARSIELQSEIARQQLDAGLDIEGGAPAQSKAADLEKMTIEELDAEVDRAIYGL